jgi:hypothetical protein
MWKTTLRPSAGHSSRRLIGARRESAAREIITGEFRSA